MIPHDSAPGLADPAFSAGACDDARRLLVVGAPNGQGRVFEQFAKRNPDWSVVHAPTYLSAIAEACRSATDAVVAIVPPSDAGMPRAVSGLREAAGRTSRLLLCCGPESEPGVRNAIASGADDYLITPIDITELESAIGVVPPVRFTGPPSAAVSELSAISDALSALGTRPGELLQKIAELIRRAVGARGVTISVQGAGASSGEPVSHAVLAFPLFLDEPNASASPPTPVGSPAEVAPSEPTEQTAPASGQPAPGGRLILGEKTCGPYTPSDMERLTQYAALAGRILAAAHTQRRWRELAMIDPGSGLPNRRYMLEKLPAILARAAREHFAVTVLLFDVDDFKSFNDRHGHDAGDEILRIVGQLFRKTCREQDIVTRYGGDEFAVVFWDPAGPREPGSRHPQQALSVVDRFTEALREQRFSRLGPEGGRVTISGGLATYPWDATTAESLISRADEALLAAKRAGKNRVVAVGG